jgi:two-component system alkaline phosphatase synthesis response regulator PhoP
MVLTASGSAALEIAHDLQPDLILLDLMMPEMDGGEVSRRLRSDPITAGIPIVIMSAHDTTGAIAATLPIDDLLRKPFTVKQLYATVSRWMEARDG